MKKINKKMGVLLLAMITLPQIVYADTFIYKHKLNGVKAEGTVYNPKAPEPPPCSTPSDGIGTKGLFCGHESEGELVYIGDMGSNSILASLSHEPNNRYLNRTVETGAVSSVDGLSNTIRIANNYPTVSTAAKSCFDKGNGWYLPAINELLLFSTNKSLLIPSEIGLNNSSQYVNYWSSTDRTSGNGSTRRNTAIIYKPYLDRSSSTSKSSFELVKCVRRF